MWKSIATITLAILFSACSSKQSQTMSQEEYQKLLSQTYMLTPDSLLTNDQIELKIKVMDFMMTNVDMKDHKQVLQASRKDLEESGIPSLYYDILQYQINETNTAIENLIKEGSIRAEDLHLESSFKEAKDHYWKTDRPELEARLSR